MAQSVKDRLRALRLFARRRFGQNFLNDASDLRFIAQATGLQKGESVFEIGPGLGALTEPLLDQGLHVIAVEKDRSLARYLQECFKGRALQVFAEDVLTFDPSCVASAQKPITVAGNIPYNITSPILFWLIEHRLLVQQAVLTVQWEVAQRLAGKPGHEAWGALSVSVQAYAEVELLRRIPKSHFYPSPNVDSAVVRLRFLETPRFRPEHRERFHELVARAFQKRRKTLLNALEDDRRNRGKERLSEAFRQLAIDPKRRPETLSVSEWVSLAACLSK